MEEQISEKEVIEKNPVKRFFAFLEKARKEPTAFLFEQTLKEVKDYIASKIVFMKDITDHIFACRITTNTIAFYLDNHLVIEFGASVVGNREYLYCDIYSLDAPIGE